MRPRRLAFLLVLAGVLFRIWAVGHARFTGDESYFWATARNIATLNAAPIYGPPLTGSSAYHPGPLFYYLMAIPQRFGTSPWLGGIFVAALHGLAAWLFSRLVERALGARASLVALALWLFAPWDVLYADRVWLSCVAPVWGMATVWAAIEARTARWGQGLLVFLALVCPELHMSAPVVWIVAAVLLWRSPPESIAWRAIAAGVAGAIVAYAPAIYGELAHDFENTRAILTKGTGNLSAAGMWAAPLRVFGNAVLYGTSEIGYHFARGYWSPFAEGRAYFSLAGARAWLELHGVWSNAGLVSIALGFVAWGAGVAGLVRGLRAARAAGSIRKNLGEGDTMMLALLLGLTGATALLVAAKKEYFPHYTNLLMPLLLWPVAAFLDRLLSASGRTRAIGAVAGVLSIAAMASSSVRYYVEVDALNGLDETIAMVEEVIQEPGPIGVEFEGFHNAYAWELLADVGYHHPIHPSGDAPVIFRVHNARPHVGPVPPGAKLFGPVLLERRVVRPRPSE